MPKPSTADPDRIAFSADYSRGWMFAFLVAFAAGGNVSQAAKIAGVARRTVYLARETDPAFKASWDDALAEAADRIRAEVTRRGIEGWEEPVFGMLGGKGAGEGQIGTVRKYDSGLLALLAKAHCPEFKEKAPPASPVNINVVISAERLASLQERTRTELTRRAGGRN